MNKDAFIVIRGEGYWCKIVGPARPYTGNPKYDKGPEWTMDIVPDEASRKLLKQYDLTEKLRDPSSSEKEDRTETFLSLRVLESKPDGSKNKPPRIVDVRGVEWDNREIGNKSILDVKVKVKDYGKGVQKGVYLQAVRVLKLNEFKREEFAPVSEDDEFYAPSEDFPAAEPGEFDDETV